MKKVLKVSIGLISIMLLLSTGALAAGNFGNKAIPADVGKPLQPLATVNSVAFSTPSGSYYLVPFSGVPDVKLTGLTGTLAWPFGLQNFVDPSVVFLDQHISGTYTPFDPIYLVANQNLGHLTTGDLKLSNPGAGTKITDGDPANGKFYQRAPGYWSFEYVDLDSSASFTQGDRVYLHTYLPIPDQVVNGDLQISAF